MIDTELRPKQRKNEIRFRYSVIASSEGPHNRRKRVGGEGWMAFAFISGAELGGAEGRKAY